MNTTKDFEVYFKSEIRPKIHQLEQNRSHGMTVAQKYRQLLNRVLGVITVGAMALLFSTGNGSLKGLIAILVIALFVFLIARFAILDSWLKTHIGDDITDGFKNKVITPMLHFFDPSLQLYPHQSLEQEILTHSGLFVEHEIATFSGEDLVTGSYKNVSLRFSEMLVQKLAPRNSKERYRTVFKGIFVEATLPAALPTPIYLIPFAFTKSSGGISDLLSMKFFKGKDMSKGEQMLHNFQIATKAMNFRKWTVEHTPFKQQLQKADLPHPLFKEHFSLFAGDTSKAVAYFLEKKGFLTYLEELVKNEDAKAAMEEFKTVQVTPTNVDYLLGRSLCSFALVGNKIYFTIPYGNHAYLETDLTKSLTDFDKIKAYYEELKVVFDIVELLAE